MHFYSRLRSLGAGVLVGLFISLGLPTDNRAAITIFNDLIVDGSECVGIDCVNDENFGVDTLRLKENNLRIHFDDTSSNANFPRNDWRIIINDRANGGPERFAIEDSTHDTIPFTIEAGAEQNSLYIAPDLSTTLNLPRVGIGTTDPRRELTIVSDDSPTVRLQQSTAVGLVGWALRANEAGFIFRTVTSTATDEFIGQPVQFSAVAPNQALEVLGNGDVRISGMLIQGSSRDLKDKLVSLDAGQVLDKVAALPVQEWSYTHDPATRHIGPMAEDFHAAFGVGSDDTHLAPADTAGVALVAIQALDQQLKTLQHEMTTLEQHNAELHNSLVKMEHQLAQIHKDQKGETRPTLE